MESSKRIIIENKNNNQKCWLWLYVELEPRSIACFIEGSHAWMKHIQYNNLQEAMDENPGVEIRIG